MKKILTSLALMGFLIIHPPEIIAQGNARVQISSKNIPDALYGTASYYANKFEGRLTANGWQSGSVSAPSSVFVANLEKSRRKSGASLLQANGNQNRAAALLKISRQALAYQIKELGILVRKE